MADIFLVADVYAARRFKVDLERFERVRGSRACQPALSSAGFARMYVGPQAADEGPPRMG
jgi:hypothetical protein